jgi:hypothetical protein
MRHLQLTVSLFTLILLSGCASTEIPRLQDRSIVEALDSASFTQAMPACRITDVTYCINGAGGVKECTCIDAREMAYGSGGIFGHY